MRYYRRDNDSGGGCLLLQLGIGAVYIAQSLGGWTGVLALAGVVVLGIVFQRALGSWAAARKESARLRAPCDHGLQGAKANPNLCAECLITSQRAAREAAIHLEEAKREREDRAARSRAAYLEKIRIPQYLLHMHPREFEELACVLFEAMGYAVERTPYIGDGGVDAFLRKGDSLAILQAKRVKGSVGEPILRDLFGTMHARGASQAFVVTTGRVSPQARVWIKDKAITVYELDELRSLLDQYLPGAKFVPPDFNPESPSVGTCPQCGELLRVVNWHGKHFIGCTGFPACRYKRSIREPRY